jgi:hypothetical protein
MSKIRVTFDSDAAASAFATKWNLSAPAGNSLDVDWHLAEDAVADATASTHEQLDATEHEFIAQGDRATLELHGTIEADLGNGFFKVKSTTGVNLAKASTSIDSSSAPVTFLASSITAMDSTETALDPTSAEGQWARIRIASTYRPLTPSYIMHDTTFLSKPELYIMDSGIDSTHPEFQGTDLEIEEWYTVPDIYAAGDQFGHGTAVASMAVGKNLGITTNVKVKTIKIAGIVTSDPTVLPAEADQVFQSASISQLGDALDALLAVVIADAAKTRIINCSWGVTRSAWLDSKFQTLMDAGVTLISAAGNDGIDVSLVTPAGIIDSLTIGAIDKFDIPTGFNNISPSDSDVVTAAGLSLDMFAPGDNVMTAHIANFGSVTGDYSTNSGTSFSAPLISGIACVIGSMNEGLVNMTAMKEAILSTGTKNALLFEDDTFTGFQNNLGYVVTADPLASYKELSMVSYLGVSQEDDLVVDLNSNLDLSKITALFPDDVVVYSINWIDPAIEAKYSPYVVIDSATGVITVSQATGVTLADDVSLESVDFIGIATTNRITISTNTIFYFNPNPAYSDSLSSDVTLALTDVNSISFFAVWSTSLK